MSNQTFRTPYTPQHKIGGFVPVRIFHDMRMNYLEYILRTTISLTIFQSYALPILCASNIALFQSHTLPILCFSNLTHVQSHIFPIYRVTASNLMGALPCQVARRLGGIGCIVPHNTCKVSVHDYLQ